MKVYGHPISTATRKVLCMFAEKGIKPEFALIDLTKGEHKKSDYMAQLHPFGQVPVLEDNGFRLYEARAIMRYLDEVLPGEKLTPADPKQRAMMEQWISVEMSNFTPAAMKTLGETFFAPIFGATPNMAKAEEGRVALAPCLDVLNRHLEGKTYLVGDKFSIADIGYLPYIDYLYASNEGGAIDKRPNVASWWKRCTERKSWQIATGKG